jgi:peptidoglycan/LPS O-acetylase OafA/YrhL
MKYRPEIDGLRAVAVLSVILYHAHFIFLDTRLFEGGFIGVDVFFVISGYLITGLILKDLLSGDFSFVRFYERRARRILPALFFVMLISIPYAYRWLFPKALKDLVYSIVSSLFFGSNFFFFAQDGYIAEPNLLKPFLHTWSLSIEEQFYLLFPVLLILIWKYARQHLMIFITLMLLMSLQLADWGTAKSPTASFLLLPTRMWELLAGALLAKLEIDGRRVNHPLLETLMPALGLFLIVHSVVFFDDGMRHPGFITTLPVFGVMLIIWFGGKGDLISSLLSSKLSVGIGLISYSLYLWHQPLFAFARSRSAETLTQQQSLQMFVLCFFLGYFTWRFIEQPFRKKGYLSTKILWSFCSICMVAILAFGAATYYTDGFPDRYPPLIAKISQIEAHLGAYAIDGVSCANQGAESACKPNGDGKNWYLVGDSLLSALASPLWNYLQTQNVNLFEFTKWRCWYSPNLDSKYADWCVADNQKIRASLLTHPPGVVVIMSLIQWYLEGIQFNNHEGGADGGDPSYLVDAKTKAKIPMGEMQNEIAARIEELIKYGHKVIIVYPFPEVGWDVIPNTIRITRGKTKTQIEEYFRNGGLTTSYEVFLNRTKTAYEAYNLVPDSPNLVRVYPEKIFCNNSVKGRCVTADKDNLFYFDSRHPTLPAAKFIVDQIIRQTPSNWFQ